MQDKFQALLELLRPELRDEIRSLAMNPEILRDMVIRNHKTDVIDSEGNFIFHGKADKGGERTNRARRGGFRQSHSSAT